MSGLVIGAHRLARDLGPHAACAPDERTKVRWRDYIGVFSLVGCPALMIAFLALRHELSPMVGARAVAALYALGVVPGYLAQRYLFGIRARAPFEALLSSLLLGTLLTPLLWFTLCWLGLSGIFYPLMLALALAVPLSCGWHRQMPRRLRRLVTPAETPMLWLALALAVLWSWQLDLVTIRDGKALIHPHNDNLLHVSLVAELARGVPPATVPFIAIADKWAYHHMPDVWCDMIRRVAGTDARTAFLHLALPLCYVLVSFACYVGLVRRFGRAAGLVGAGCVLAFAGYPGSRCLFTNWLLTYLPSSYPSMFGLIGAFLILYYVSTMARERPRGPLLLISILSALLFWYKANFALAIVPAVSIFCIISLARRRDFRWLLACLAVQGLLVGIRQLDLSTADFRAELVFEPGRYIRYLWWDGTLWLKAKAAETAGSTWLSSAVHALISIRRNVDALPGLLKWPAVYVLCMLFLFHLGMLIVLYAVVRCGFGQRRSQANGVDHLMLLILLVCVVGFVFFPIMDRWVWNISKHVLPLVYALSFALMGPVSCDFVGRMMRKGKKTVVLTISLLLAAFVGNAYALAHRALWITHYEQPAITQETYECYRYIEAATPPDTAILQPWYDRAPYSTALTLRRSAMECSPYWDRLCDTKRILSDIRSFYAGTAADSALAILERYDVDYVVADRSPPRVAGYAPFLTQVFRSNDLAVFRVERQDKGISAARGDADERIEYRRGSAGL